MDSRHRAWAQSWTSSAWWALGRPRLYSTGKARSPSAVWWNSTTSAMPVMPNSGAASGMARTVRTPLRRSILGLSAFSCSTRPSAVCRFSSQSCSTWISAHCRGQYRWCCRAERGMASSSIARPLAQVASDQLAHRHAGRNGRAVDAHLIVRIGTRCCGLVAPRGLHLDGVEQHVRGCVAHRTFVLEHDELARGHLAAGGGAIVLEHVDERAPEQIEI